MFVTCIRRDCQYQSWVEKRPANGLYRCPNCLTVFSLSAAAPEASGRPQTQETPLLTDPHLCYQCGGELDVLAARRRCTVDCPWCDHRTAVYAIVYRCLGCGSLLASPGAMEGEATHCPKCGVDVEVPRDEVFRAVGEPVDDRWFAIACEHCQGTLEALKAKVGQLGVCRHCLKPVRVPKWGYHLAEGGGGILDPLAALGEGGLRHCPHCKLLKPSRATVCPHCGAADA
jgi:hypothetical protein